MEIVGLMRQAPQHGCHRRGNVPQAAGLRPRPATTSALLLRGVQRNEIERGQVLAKPGTIHPHTHFMGQVYVLTKEEGGRHTPFFNGYRPQFYFRTTDVTGNIKLPDGVEMVMPGDNIDMEIDADHPHRYGERSALRYPRGRPHRGFRRRYLHHGVIAKQNLKHMRDPFGSRAFIS